MTSKIEELVLDLQDYIEGCKEGMFSGGYIKVDRDEIESKIEDLRRNIPDEIRQYQRIINNQEHILAAARKKADAIIKEAEIQTDQLVSEHQIMQQAYARANEVVLVASKEATSILDKANMEANEIKSSAIEYTDSQLRIVQEIMTASMEATKSKADNYITQMQGYLDVVTNNRNELAPALAVAPAPEAYAQNEDVPVESVNAKKAADSHSFGENATSATDNNSNSDSSDSGSGIDVPDVFFNKE
ncbi:MAG: ATPase [Lachnospiraceae bacterium]|nr:ATPase [Lachnospiraceae bacterium]